MKHYDAKCLVLFIIGFILPLPLGLFASPDNHFLHYKSRSGLMSPAYGITSADLAVRRSQGATSMSLFTPYATYTIGSWPQVLTLASLSSNGRADAAIATDAYFDPANDRQLHLFAAQGYGLISRTQQLVGGVDPEAIVAGDFNQDARRDVAVALAGDNAIAVYTQTANTGLSMPLLLPAAGRPGALASGDFNGDLQPDLAAIAPLSSTIRLWRSTQQGLTPLPFQLPYSTGGYDALAAGDFNNDGIDEIAALRGAGYLTSSVVIYQHIGSGSPVSYTLTPQIGGYLPHSLAVGDVNGDGLDDVIVTAGGNMSDAYLNVFLQGPNGLSKTPIVYRAYHLPTAVVIGDVNHDGRDDVIVAHDAWATLSIYTQTISGTLSPYTLVDIPYADRYRPNALSLGDIDGNGGLDVGLVDGNNGLVVLTNTMTAPSAKITSFVDPVFLPFRTMEITATGTASGSAVAVQVRLRGTSNWTNAALANGLWQITLPLPQKGRLWRLEARAIDSQGHVQSPVDQHRIGRESGNFLPLVMNNFTAVQAQFTPTAAVGVVPFTATFTNTSLGAYTNSLWDFGDGVTSTQQNPTHVYSAIGTFTITLTVSNATEISTVVCASCVRALLEMPDLIVNGGFEQNAAWTFDNPPELGGYTTALAHSGQRSAKLGVLPTEPLRYGYAMASQPVTIPTNAVSVTLSFWYWPRYEGGSASLGSNYQFVKVLDSSRNTLAILIQTSDDAAGWQRRSFNLTSYAGQKVYIVFGVFTDGDFRHKKAAMYVDDVSLQFLSGPSLLSLQNDYPR